MEQQILDNDSRLVWGSFLERRLMILRSRFSAFGHSDGVVLLFGSE